MDEDEKTYRIYEVLTQRILNSDRLLAERANLFLLANSVLFAGFVLLIDDSRQALSITICCGGIVLSVITGVVSWGVTREMHLWLVMCQYIEQKQPGFESLKRQELIPYSAWNYWEQGESKFGFARREQGVPIGLPTMGKWEKRTAFGLFDPWRYYKFYVPGLFTVIWVAALVTVTVTAFS